MTLKQTNKQLTEELQKTKDKIVNLQEDLKKEQTKRFKLQEEATLKTKIQAVNKDLSNKQKEHITRVKELEDILKIKLQAITLLQDELKKQNDIKQDYARLKRKEGIEKWQ